MAQVTFHDLPVCALGSLDLLSDFSFYKLYEFASSHCESFIEF